MKRLRDPRQALAFLAGIAYVGFFVLRPFLVGTVSVRRAGAYSRLGMNGLGEFAPVIQLVVAVALAVIALVTWITASSRPAFRFSEAEIHLLLPAPLTRRQVLGYALLKQQAGILVGTLVLFVFTALRGARSPADALARLFAYWGFLTLLDLHIKGVSLWKARQAELSTAAASRRLALALLVGAAWVGAIAFGLWQAWLAARAGSAWAASDVRAVILDLAEAAHGGVAGAALAPFFWLAAPIARTGAARVGGALFLLLLLSLHYEWVMRSSARFEEAALARAGRSVRRGLRIGLRRGNWEALSRLARSRSPFRLEAARAPELAITWKNLLLRGRMPLRRGAVLTLLVLAGAAAALAAANLLGVPPAVDGMLAGIGFCLMLVMPLVAGNFLRNDLHVDFQHLATLRAWPISGWRLIAAEILAPAAALLWIELAAAGLVVATALAATVGGAGARHEVLGPLPKSLLGGSPFAVALAAALVSLAIVALAVGLFSIALQNLAILLFPGWVPLGYSIPRGTAMFGQNLVVGLGRLIGLALGAIAPLLAGGLLYLLLNVALGLRLAPWELPLLAVAIALPFLAEVYFMVRAAGAIWDRLDPSQEILDPA